MIRHIILILILCPILIGSCSGRKNKTEHKDIIPEKVLVSILTEIHIADGLLSLPKIRYLYSESDTLSSYIDIIEKYGYSKELMDRTMRFYFIKRPKKLIKIYDKVLGRLSEMESRIDEDMSVYRIEALNFWPGKQSYSFPDPTGTDTAWFDFSIDYYGTYNLKFTLTIYPDDQSVNPRSGVFLSHSDSTDNEKRIYLSTIPFIKDGQSHTYNIFLVQNLPAPVRLKGWFIDQENHTAFLEKHIRVDNIILSRNIFE
jgi:hypothetical protein